MLNESRRYRTPRECAEADGKRALGLMQAWNRRQSLRWNVGL